jgi:N-acetylglucosamine-6-phosphate deacetylase
VAIPAPAWYLVRSRALTVSLPLDKPPDAFLLAGADLLTGAARFEKTAVLVARGKIVAVGARAERAARKHGARRIDAGGRYLAPGLVDLHTHGAAGVDFVTAGPAEFERALRHYLSRGVTSLLVSLYPTAWRESLRVVARIAGHIESRLGGGVAAGIHLEGPYLNPARPGALPGDVFRTYRRRDVDALLAAARGHVRTMTVAPERKGGRELVRHLLRAGVVPAFGHSDAGYEETRRAIDAGIPYATHLFNAMRGIHHRDPGAVTALLEDPRVAVELIADGFHVDVPVLRLVHRVKPRERVILVSDSVHPCGLKPGRYQFAGRPVRAAGGRITLLDGTLAGSLLTLDHAVALHVREVGLSPESSVLLATRNPARAVGWGRTRGEIAPGRRADLVLLDDAMRVRATWLAGRLVHGRADRGARAI